jgi:hypothetical protein
VLVESIHDSNGRRLLERYEEVYRDYFEVFGRFVTAEVTGERDLVSVLRPAMLKQRVATDRLRAQILTHSDARQFGSQSGMRPQRAFLSSQAAS